MYDSKLLQFPHPHVTIKTNKLTELSVTLDVLSPKAACVYCGSSPGTSPEFMQVATAVGKALAEAGIALVYGGGRRGLMGGVAFACARAGGKVLGVIPQAIKTSGGEGTGEKVASENAGDETIWSTVEDIVVSTMHDRKKRMAVESGAFIGLPGGFGTFEEVLEVITWNQLGIHSKPVIVLNVLGYYEPLRQMVQTGIQAGFIKPQNASLVKIVDGPVDGDWGKAVTEALRTWKPEEGAGYKWSWTDQGINAV
ncbi:lysine decarboxylase [Ceratobasidium sp. AG-Ba]|nr:lysine decarboxylase [Ceratobasidium sp. AG-Ba]